MAIEVLATTSRRPAVRPNPESAPVNLGVVSELLRGLNREQRTAVTHGEGPQLVICGPGTGKTEVVTRRVAWLIATKRARPREILALTFTDNAATEMQARVDMLVPYGQADAAIHTFHAFGDRLLREHAFELGLPGDLRLITRSEAVVLLREHLFELGLERYRPLGDPGRFLGALVDLCQRAKDEDVTPGVLLDHIHGVPLSLEPQDVELRMTRLELATAYDRYQSLMTARGLIDHGDQVGLALRLLRERADVRGAMTRKYRYLLVDEFQDMNPAQLKLLLALTGSPPNVTVVGDPDQAIYTFRGAARENIDRFAEAFPSVRRVLLRRNYRSSAPIVNAAYRVASHSDGAEGEITYLRHPIAHRKLRQAAPVVSLAFESAEEEWDGVAAQIAERIAGGARASDFAVLARSNSEIDSIARSLRVRGVPVRTRAVTDLFAHERVRPLLAFLRVIADPSRTLELYSLATSRPYELGGLALTELINAARRRHCSLWDVVGDPKAITDESWTPAFARSLRSLVEHVFAGIELSHRRSTSEVLYDYVRRSGLLGELASASDPGLARSVARFFDVVRSRASLLDDDRVSMVVPHLDALIEAGDEPGDAGPLDTEDAVSVLTVHRAKGLQFGTVYVTGLTDGRFPAKGRPPVLDLPWAELSGRAAPESDRVDEERRLFFVAITRACDELILTHHRRTGRTGAARRPSQFIAEALDTPTQSAFVQLDPLSQIEAFGAHPMQEVAKTTAPGPRSELSFSAMQDYLDCPERYRLRYVVGLPGPPHHALSYGSAMHQAVAAFHLSVARGEPLSEDDLVDAFRRAWSPEGFVSREHEEARYAAGRQALLRFREEQLAEPAPVIAVERPFVFTLDDLRIRGRMDRVDRTAGGDAIVDYKASDVRDQKKADEKARVSLQLQVYAMAQEAQTGSLPTEVRLHFLDSGVVGRARPDAKRLDRARAKLQQAAAGIRAGDFKANPDRDSCGFCPFRQVCPDSAA